MNIQNIHRDRSLGTGRKAVTLGNCVHLLDSLLWDFHSHFLHGNLKRDKFGGVEEILRRCENSAPVAKS